MPDLVTKKERNKSFSFVIFFFFFFVPFHWREILAVSSGQRPMGWLPAFAPLCLFKRMLFGLVFVCCWCLVPERGSDLIQANFSLSIPQRKSSQKQRSLMGIPDLSWLASAALLPPLQRQGPGMDRAVLEPRWEIGWGTGSLGRAVRHIGLWHQKFRTS